MIRYKKFTRRDVAFVLELLNSGVKMNYIARYVYGITTNALRLRLREWGAL